MTGTLSMPHLSTIVRLALIGMTSVLLFGWTKSIYADGYHYQIQTMTQFLANSEGELNAVSMVWTYAPNETKLLLAAKDLDPNNEEATLKQLGKAMLEDLFEFGYYSQLSLNDQPVLLNKVQDYTVNVNNDQSLTLNFKLPLKTATKIRGKTLRLRLVDPDGVAVLVYTSPQKISFNASLAKVCSPIRLTEAIMTLPNDHKPTVPTITTSCQ